MFFRVRFCEIWKKSLGYDLFRNRLNAATNLKYFSTSEQHANKKDLVTFEQIRAVRVISINRPEKRNCINVPTANALFEAFKDFDRDDGSKVAVLHGIGGNFCAGYDLEELSQSTPELMDRIGERGPVGPTRYETKKPVIAAVEGYAVAGGFELALWCDVRIVEENAIMGVFCRRFGVPLMDGGTVRLPAVVGLGRALDLIMTGRPIRAQEALQIGLANQVCACGSAVGRAVFYAESLERYPQEALRADRESARRAFSAPTLKDMLMREHERGLLALEEARTEAKRFVKGEGRHGSFDKAETPTQSST